MYRRIFVIDSTNDLESKVIKELTNPYNCEKHLASDREHNFIEFNACKRKDCVYLFTHAVILNRVELSESSNDQQRSLRKQLDDYVFDGIHLILFILNDSLNQIAYSNFRFMIVNVCHEKVPDICIVNGSMNKTVSDCIQKYWTKVLDTKDEHARSIAIQDLWDAIMNRSLEPSVVPYYDKNLNKQHNGDTKEKPIIQAANEACVQSTDPMHQSKETNAHRNDLAKEWKDDIVPALFNERNTDIRGLIKRCEDFQARGYQYNCVLLTTGSLNPIHRAHIKNLELVRKYLEERSPRWNVLAGYLSPTHDSYVRDKLGKATISGRDRCKLCELAIRDHEHETNTSHWLSVSRAEAEYRHGFVDFGPTTQALCQYLNSILLVSQRFLKHPLYIIYVCGLDHYNKCPDVRRLAKEKFIKCAIIYRKKCDEGQISSFDESSNIIYVPLDDERKNLIDISSTEIRRRWEKSPHDIAEFTYVSVIDYLKAMNFHFY